MADTPQRGRTALGEPLDDRVLAVMGDLTAPPGTETAQLDAARMAVAAAVDAGQRFAFEAGVGGGALPSYGYAFPPEGRRAQIPSAGVPLVLRRDLPLQPLSGPGALPAWAAGRAANTIGPLAGALSQQVFIDVFGTATTTSLRRASETSPFLVIAGPAPEWDGAGNGQLGSCSIWIEAALLCGAAPADSWVGLTINRGSIAGAAPTPGADGVYIVADGATVTVEVDPAAPAPATGAGPGEDARDADVRLPARASLVLRPAAGEITALDDALITAYGTTVRLTYTAAAAEFVPTLGSLVVPMQPNPAEWQPADQASTLLTLAGGGEVAQAGWALALTVADPSTLGIAGGAGGVAVLVERLMLGFGAQERPVPTATAWLLAQPGLLTIATDTGVGTGLGDQVTLYPDPDGGAGIGGRASFRFADSFSLRYLSSAAGTETILAQAALDVSLDRPVSAAGSRIPLSSKRGVFALTQDETSTTLLLEGLADTPAQGSSSIALENALLNVGSPELFLLLATVTSDAPTLEALAGKAAILIPLRGALPTLPDPYAATVTPVPRKGRLGQRARADARLSAGASLLGRVDWDAVGGPAAPALSFRLFGHQESALAEAIIPPISTAGVAATAITMSETLASAGAADAERLALLAAMAQEAAGSVPGPIALLDVSSAADQFGVRYGTARPSRQELVAATSSGPTIEGLSIVAPANTVRVITVPAVQWEPVSGPDPSGPFTPMTFPDSGGESELASRSVRLVRVAPSPAIEQMVADFARRTSPAGVVASVSFPFGIRAVALLERLDRSRQSGATLDLHRPGFTTANVAGGHQLRATAVRRVVRLKGAGPSFRGAAVQLSNGLHNGVPTGLSPIDPLTDIFNGEFGPGGTRPQVPVRQFELSGYGESLFSDWKDDTDDVPAVSEVRFDVFVGRTSVDVVQARSILYPYAVRVIRTIKMLRDNAGRVLRTDSGWQAVTDGRYRWPRPDLRTHPGVVLGVTNVANIRDTGQRWTSAAGTELMAVRFDCVVDLEDAVAGVGPGGAPSHDQLGFVQISVNPQPGMSPAEFAELVEVFGPLGGPVDALVDVGSSGQRSRIGHVGVGVAAGATGPEFAMAAWGSPVLPKAGPWSVVRRNSSDPAPGLVDGNLGVPLIRAGYAGAAPDPTSPYRFADPADLANPDTPAADYALMHATDTQRLLFPRPKVELTGPRANEISSTQPPLLADAFLLTTAVGPFPPVNNAIRFPDADYGLRPVGSGDLTLDLAHNDFAVTGGDRTIHSAGGNNVFVRYRDENGTPASVHLEVDSTQPVPWSFSVGGVELCLATSLLGEVIRFLGIIEASAAQPGRFTGGTIHFGGALSAIQVFTDFLGENDLADLPLSSRNQPSLEIALKIPIVGGPGEPEDIDVGIGTLADADVTVGVKIDLSTGAPSLKFELDGIITGRTPFPPLVAAGQVKFEIESDDSGNVFKFTLGFGVGVQADIGPFKAEAYFFQNDYLVVGTNEIGFGFGIELKATIDLVVVSAEVDVEAAALMIQTSCAPGTALWLVSQLTIGVDITICWVIDIDFEYQMQMQSNLDGGPCPAPMV